MATRLESKKVVKTSSESFTNTIYPAANVSGAEMTAQSVIHQTGQVTPYVGSRVTHRIGSPLAPATSPYTSSNWSAYDSFPTATTPVVALDLYSDTSGPGATGAVAHLYATYATLNNVNPENYISQYSGTFSPTTTDGTNSLPDISRGIATNWSGTTIARKLWVKANGYTPAGSGYGGIILSNDYPGTATPMMDFRHKYGGSSGPATYATFVCGPTTTGSIFTPGTTTSYNTSSDYRLKENVTPIESGLDLIAALKPRVWKWKDSEEVSMGFVAHEVQEDSPLIASQAVTGVKDGVIRYGNLVDVEGNFKLDDMGEPLELMEPTAEEAATYAEEGYTWTQTREEPVYQSMDASFMVSPLVAAVKELKALVDAQQAKITQLEQRVSTLEAA